MRTFSIQEVSAIIDQTWNGCVDFHNNQGKGSVQYPDLDELKVKLLAGNFNYQFRKVKHLSETETESYPLESDKNFDTIGLYKTYPDGTQEWVDEMNQEEMERFRNQEDFEEVLNKLK